MITITKQNDGVLFAFQDSDKYLYGNGSILVPFNTLSIVADESDMITLKKAASNDVFLSARYDTDFGYRSKDDAIDDLKGMLFAETGGGGSESGITSGEVQTMIDNSLEDYYTDDEVDAGFDEVNSAVTAVANDVSTLSGQVATKVNTTDFNAYSAATDSRLAEDEEVTAAALNNLDETKQGKLVYYEENTEEGWAEMKVTSDDGEGSTEDNHINIGGGVAEIGIYNEYDDGQGNVTVNNTSIYADQIMVTLQAGITENGDTTSTEFSVEATGVTINGDAVATEPYVDAAISGKADASAVTQVNNVLTAHTANTTVHVSQAEKDIWNAKVDTSAITTAITSGSTDSEIPTAKATYDAIQAGGGGGSSVTVDTSLDSGSTNPVANSAITTAIDTKADKTTAAGGIYISNQSNIREVINLSNQNGVVITGAYKQAYCGRINSRPIIKQSNTVENFQLVETSAITSAMTSSSTDAQVPSAKAVYDQLGGLKFVKLTQAEYDQLVNDGETDPDTLYIVTNVVS